MVALIANGHVPNGKGVPGLAKTTAAQTLADSIKKQVFTTYSVRQTCFQVISLDLKVYNYTKGTFETQLGPVR